jgi:alpha-amylase
LDDNGKYQWYKDASKNETLIPESVPTECDLTINYKSTLGNDVAAYVYKETNKPAGEWPGKTMTAAEGHEGWYTMHLTLDNSTDYNLILNDDGHGKQLDEVTLSTKGKAEAEYWFDGSLSERGVLNPNHQKSRAHRLKMAALRYCQSYLYSLLAYRPQCCNK